MVLLAHASLPGWIEVSVQLIVILYHPTKYGRWTEVVAEEKAGYTIDRDTMP